MASLAFSIHGVDGPSVRPVVFLDQTSINIELAIDHDDHIDLWFNSIHDLDGFIDRLQHRARLARKARDEGVTGFLEVP